MICAQASELRIATHLTRCTGSEETGKREQTSECIQSQPNDALYFVFMYMYIYGIHFGLY